MSAANNSSGGFRLPVLQGVLPVRGSQIPTELIAGITLAALAVPEVMGYTKIAGTPVITGLYTMLIPMALFAIFGSSRHLVVGADSATAAILAAGLVGLAATGSDEYMALAAVLSAVVFLIGVDLVDIKGMKNIYAQRRSEFWVTLITTLMVVFVGVEQGIILAIVLSLIDHTRRGYRPKNVVMVPADSGLMHAQPVATRAQALPGLLIYRFTHSMYYANAEQLSEQITDLANNPEPPLRWLCMDASAVDDVDFSAAETLRSIFGILKDKGIRLVVAQVMDDVKAGSRYKLEQLFGEDAFYDTLEDVMQDYQKQTGAAVT